MKLSFAIAVTVATIVVSIFLFWNGQGGINFSSAINAERFNQFGGFVAGILSAFTLILLIYSYRNTTEQSFTNTFFNHLQVHDSVVRDLKSNREEIRKLNDESSDLLNKSNFCESRSDNELIEECKNYRKKPPANNYFEILYRILHIRHKYKEELELFFEYENWRIGHYLRSYISVIELIQNCPIKDNDKRKFYVRILHSRSTSDEIRLIFYYIISREEKEDKDKIKKKELAKLFKFASFDFFEEVDGFKKELVNSEEDMKRYNKILF